MMVQMYQGCNSCYALCSIKQLKLQQAGSQKIKQVPVELLVGFESQHSIRLGLGRVCFSYFNHIRRNSVESLGEFDICYMQIEGYNTWYMTQVIVIEEMKVVHCDTLHFQSAQGKGCLCFLWTSCTMYTRDISN